MKKGIYTSNKVRILTQSIQSIQGELPTNKEPLPSKGRKERGRGCQNKGAVCKMKYPASKTKDGSPSNKSMQTKDLTPMTEAYVGGKDTQ